MSAAIVYVRPDQCRFCKSRRCHHAIISDDGSFDEVACWRHSDDLTLLSRQEEGRPVRRFLNTYSTANMRRGRDPATVFRVFEVRIAELEELRRLGGEE